jgi:hypothetical protein
MIQSYARVCLRNVARALEMGGREHPPSTAEIESVTLRHPGEFSHPMSLPIYLSNDNNVLVGIDYSSSVDEVTLEVCQAAGIRPPRKSG